MKKVWFALLFLLLAASLGAQQEAVSTLRGTVVDAKSNQPLVGATVIVDSTYNAMADGRGAFAVNGIPRGEAQVLILFTGYETHKATVAFDRASVDLGTVRLEEEAKELDEVVAVGTAAAIVQKGDTTQYNAAAYKTNPDADASDLLAKMPGMEVEGGVVKAQGDTVKRVYVNNELFLGEDAMQVLSTLPADLVESMQMFDEQPDDARFSGYDDGRTQRALNVVTRGGRINRQIEATVPLAYGFETMRELDGSRSELYNFSPNLLVMSPKVNFNISGSLSNIGGGMGSGRRMAFGRGGGFTTNKNINLNVGRTWDRDNSLNLNYSFGKSDNENRTITHADYLPTDYFDSRTTQDTTRSESTSRNHNAGLTARFTKGRNMLSLRSNVSFGDGDSWNGKVNRVDRDGALWSLLNSTTTGTSDSYSVSNQLDWVVRLGQKAGRTLNVSAAMQISENKSVSLQRGEMIELDRDRVDYITSPENYTTTSRGPNKSFRGGISYNEPLADRLKLNLNYGVNYSSGQQERRRVNDDTGLIEENTSTISATDRLSQSGRAGLTFTLPDKLTATAGLELISMRDERDYTLPTDTLKIQTYTTLRPNAVLTYRFSKQRTLRMNYSGMPGVPSLDNLTNVVNDEIPNQLRAGNPNLKRSYTHHFNLRYNNTNPTTYNNFNLSVQGSVARNTSVTKTIYFPKDQDTYLPEYDYTAPAGSELRMPVNANGTVSLRAGAGYSFRLLNQRVSFDGTYNFSQRPSYIGDQLNKARTNEAGFRLGINSNIENIDFSINSRTSYRRTTYSQDPGKNTETFIQSLSANVNILMLQQRVVFNTNYSMNYSNQNISTTNDLRAYVGYRFLKRRTAEFRVEINDIFNQTPDFNFSEGTESETRTWSLVRGRYVMARFQYRFNSLQSLADRVGRNTPGEGAPDERFDRERMRQMRESGEVPEEIRQMIRERGGGMRMGGGF